MIPKLIHQTFRQRSGLSRRIEQCIEQNIAVNPDWEHCFYSDQDAEDVIADVGGLEAVELYRRIDPSYGAAKADYFRYACMYRRGGVYLDLKSICTRALTPSLRSDDTLVLSRWNRELYPNWGVHEELRRFGGELQQWFLIAERGSKLALLAFESATENLARYRFLRDGWGQLAVLRTTGPIAFTKTLAPHLDVSNHRMVDSWDDLGLRYDAFHSLDSRIREIGTNYRDARRPLVIPAVIPMRFTPLYFATTDRCVSIARAVVRSLRR